jgi:hypothetical protein
LPSISRGRPYVGRFQLKSAENEAEILINITCKCLLAFEKDNWQTENMGTLLYSTGTGMVYHPYARYILKSFFFVCTFALNIAVPVYKSFLL